jgi:hypothetical protein
MALDMPAQLAGRETGICFFFLVYFFHLFSFWSVSSSGITARVIKHGQAFKGELSF